MVLKNQKGYKYIQIGLESSFSVLIGFFVGYKADIYFGFLPWLTLTGAFLGIAAGIYRLLKLTDEND